MNIMEMESENVIHRNEPQQEQADTENNSSSHSTTTTTNNTSTISTAKLVNWRGNTVPEKEVKALRHVVGNLQDHFGHQRPDPNVTFNTSALAHSADDNYWRGDIDFTYNINGERCNLAYIGK